MPTNTNRKTAHKTKPALKGKLWLIRLLLEDDDHDRFNQASWAEGRSMSSQAQRVIIEWLNRQESNS